MTLQMIYHLAHQYIADEIMRPDKYSLSGNRKKAPLGSFTARLC